MILSKYVLFLYNKNNTLQDNYTLLNLELTPLKSLEYLKYNIHLVQHSLQVGWEHKNHFMNVTILILLLYLFIDNIVSVKNSLKRKKSK